jgi:hypothetical protein
VSYSMAFLCLPKLRSLEERADQGNDREAGDGSSEDRLCSLRLASLASICDSLEKGIVDQRAGF